MTDDGPVIGRQQGEQPRGLAGPKPWMAAVGLAALAVIVLGSGAGAPTPAPTTSTTTTSTTIPERPSVPVPPVERGDLVGQTMRWEAVEGLEAAASLSDITRFDGTYWAVGRRNDTIALWRGDGVTWEPAGIIDGTNGWHPRDLAKIDENLIVAADRRGGPGGLFVSRDGATWQRVLLESSDPEFPRTAPSKVFTTHEGVLVTGSMHPPDQSEALLGVLPPEVADLLRSGDAYSIADEDGGIRVYLDLGLQIARIPEEEVPADYRAFDYSAGQAWQGPDLGRLEAERTDLVDFPAQVVADESGTLFGLRESQIVSSTDGDEWDPIGALMSNVARITPWRGGLALTGLETGLRFWTPDSAAPREVLPKELAEAGRQAFQVFGGEWGLTLVHAEPNGPLDREPEEPVVLATTEEGEIHLHGDGWIELVRGGEGVWSRHLRQTTHRIDDQGRLVLDAEDKAIPIELEQWRRAVSQMGISAEDVNLVHTMAGDAWSSTSWAEITGDEGPASLRVLEGDDFVLVADVDQRGSIEQVVLGRPMESFVD